jgi:hypothetical protein
MSKKYLVVAITVISTLVIMLTISSIMIFGAESGRGEGIVSDCGRLQVSDAHVCAEDGTQISLGGMSFFWSQWSNKYYTSDTVDYLVDNFDVSLVRAAYGVPEDEGPSDTEQEIRNVVEAAINRDIYVIIDWHGEGDLTPYKEEAKTFFSEMVKDYGDNNNIIYELWNEPTSQSTETIKSYCQEMTEYIRNLEDEYGQSHKLIICGSETWSQYPNSYQISDPGDNVAYTFHGYFDNQSGHLSQMYNNCTDAMNMGNAVFVTEYGASYDVHTNTEEAIQWCQDNNISMAAWSVNDKVEDWSIFTSDMDSLTDIGNYYKEKLTNWVLADVNSETTVTPAPSDDSETDDSSNVLPEKIALKAEINGLYVSAEDYGNDALIANRESADTWETFEVTDLGDNKIALKATINEKYVCAADYGNSPLIASSDSIDTWETFEVSFLGDNKITLKAEINGLYVSAEDYGNDALIANRESADTWETFEYIEK